MRKPRRIVEGALYHVTARANRKEMILEPRRIKEVFLSVLERAKKKYDFQVENFCIMGNHFHLMVRPRNKTSLSALMQWVLSVFAMAWNRIHRLTVHVWGERFFSRIVDGLMAFVQIFAYIDNNPVESGLADHPEDWPFGGLWSRRTGRHTILEPPTLLLEIPFPGHRTLQLSPP